MTFPILSVIVFTPIIAGMLILLFPAERKNEVRVTALAAATFALLLSIWVYFSYDQAAAGYQFQEAHNWLPASGYWLPRWCRRHEHSACSANRCGHVHWRADLLGY